MNRQTRPDLPIDEILPALLEAMAGGGRFLLEAPPGAGKTTAVPPALLDAPWLGSGKIVMLEPRRIAARMAAQTMAQWRGENIGETIGLRIRFDTRESAATRIVVVTEGVLTRMIQDDPALSDVGVVIFDEFHERHLHADLGLALALEVQRALRPDLRLLLMSATLAGDKLATQLDATRLSSAGRAFPVEISYQAPQRDEQLPTQLLRALRTLDADSGDVLVFLPGRREIELCRRALSAHELCADAEVLPLHGELSVADQAQVLRGRDDGKRQIVLSTNVAESSVTLPRVRTVIDSGLAREPRFDPAVGFSTLKTVTISLASATQRAGRAGRVASGRCIRLFGSDLRLDPDIRPEILQADLAPLLLELKSWGSADLPFIDPPPAGHLEQAAGVLHALGALAADASLSAHGRGLAQHGTHPRFANMLLRATGSTQRALACDLIALLESRDPLIGQARFDDDLLRRWQALAGFRRNTRDGGADRHALRQIDQLARDWRRRSRAGEPPMQASAEDLAALLVHAYTDWVGYGGEGLRYQLANGRGALLRDDSSLRGATWLVVASFVDGAANARVRLGLRLDGRTLEAHYAERFTERTELDVDPVRMAVSAWRCKVFDAIVLSRHSIAVDDPLPGVLALIRAKGLSALPFSESLQQWRTRVLCVLNWMPDIDFPDLSDAHLLATLDDWLAPYLTGVTRLAQIDSGKLSGALHAQLSHAQRRELDNLAPTQLDVPSGRQAHIDYRLDGPPVLAVKLQEMFGAQRTPSVAGGRVPLLLHLLSPAGRPVQVTQDLLGFWQGSYADVKKDLKGRYPRHPWPDDPLRAIPTAKTKRHAPSG